MSPSSLPLILALSFVWCHCVSCQDPELIPLSSINTLNSGVANVSQILEGMMTEMNTKLLEMDTLMNAMDTTMVELQETQTEQLTDIQTKLETLEDVQTMLGILEERDQLRDSSNQTCRSDQIEALQDALVAQIQAMNLHIEQCTSRETISDLQEELKTSSSNQTCSDRVEVLQDSFTTEFQALKKLIGNCLSFDMMKIFRHDIETAMNCAYPSYYISSLGCITSVRTTESWPDARNHCQQNGGRLLEGITSHKELDKLKIFFRGINSGKMWLGIKDGEWIGGGESLRNSSFWKVEEPGQGNQRCGYVQLSLHYPAFGNLPCDDKRFFFCQAEAPQV